MEELGLALTPLATSRVNLWGSRPADSGPVPPPPGPGPPSPGPLGPLPPCPASGCPGCGGCRWPFANATLPDPQSPVLSSIVNVTTTACEAKCASMVPSDATACVGFTRKDAEGDCYFYSRSEVSGLFSHSRPDVSWHPNPRAYKTDDDVGPSVSFGTPMVVGSSDVATANGTHYWFPEVMLRLSPTSVTLQVDRCEYSGLCPLRKHPVACEQIVVSTDPEYTEFVDLNMGAPHGLSLGQAVPTAGAAPKQTLTGSPTAPGFLQTWSTSTPPTIENTVPVTYSGIPPATSSMPCHDRSLPRLQRCERYVRLSPMIVPDGMAMGSLIYI